MLWGGLVVSTLGSATSAIVYPLLILALTDRPPRWASPIPCARGALRRALLCRWVLAVDRWDRRRVMLLRWAGAWPWPRVPVAVALGHVEVWHLYAVALVEKGC